MAKPVQESAMPHVWSVSELMTAVKSDLESRYYMVDLEGEITGFKIWTAGHAYFTLKDDRAQLSAIMFASDLQACAARANLKDGAKVKVRGRVTVSPRSQCQMIIRRLKMVGEGELMQRFLELKAKLGAEGIFDSERKKPRPYLPRRIGIITSFAGAVVHDMCRVLMRRMPAVEIRLYPCIVQGDSAPSSIIAGLKYFNTKWLPDIIIFGRGGGSFEDLFCYNDEMLVRAVATSRIPTIAAIGHETDFTLCDFAADLRAGTPSMAAELAVPELDSIVATLMRAKSSLAGALRGKYEWFAQRIDQLSGDLAAALKDRSSDFSRRLELASSRLELLSPFNVLQRGYSLTTDQAGHPLRDASKLTQGDCVHTRLSSGEFYSTVSSTKLHTHTRENS